MDSNLWLGMGLGAFFMFLAIGMFLGIRSGRIKKVEKIMCPKCSHPALRHTSNYHQFKARHRPDDDTYSACSQFVWKLDGAGLKREGICRCDMSFSEVLMNNGVDPQDKASYSLGMIDDC